MHNGERMETVICTLGKTYYGATMLLTKTDVLRLAIRCGLASHLQTEIHHVRQILQSLWEWVV